jgi:hypothetical protein
VGLDDGRLEGAVGDVEVAERLIGGELAALGLEIAEDDPAHSQEDAQEAGAGPVDADVAQQQARAGDEHGGGEQEGGGAEVAGHGDTVEDELVDVDDGDVAAVAVDVDAGAQEHPLGVVAAVLGLAESGGAVGGERGEQQAGLDLGAGDGQLVGDRV